MKLIGGRRTLRPPPPPARPLISVDAVVVKKLRLRPGKLYWPACEDLLPL